MLTRVEKKDIRPPVRRS